MKKLSFFAIAFVAIAFVACGGKKAQTTEVTQDEKSFEQKQIEASIKMHFDSIASEFSKMPQLPFVQDDNGGLTLTTEEKQVKPDYLLNPNIADEAATLAEKYRIISALNVDKKIASLYEMPTEEFDKAVTKLAADINDPSFKAIDDSNTLFETSSTLYDAMEQNGRLNYFWQIASAALVEELFVINQNTDKFLSIFDDDAAANVTYRIVLILDAVNRLSAYDPDIKPVAEAIAPLNVLNAISVNQLKEQLAAASDKIVAARKALIK